MAMAYPTITNSMGVCFRPNRAPATNRFNYLEIFAEIFFEFAGLLPVLRPRWRYVTRCYIDRQTGRSMCG